MATVHAIAPRETATITGAVDAYLATLAGPESAGTKRVYRGVLSALAEDFGPDTDVAALQPRAIAAWFAGRWGERSPTRWNTALDALRSASRYWADQGWTGEDPVRLLRRRRKAPDRSRALSRADVERLLTRDDIAIRERTLWRMLYETAARSAEVLRLDVGDLDLANRPRQGLPQGRRDRRDRLADRHRPAPAAAVAGLGIVGERAVPQLVQRRPARRGLEQVLGLPVGQPGPPAARVDVTRRQLDAGAPASEEHGPGLPALQPSTPMLMAKSGHTSVASLARYARPSAEALARWQERNGLGHAGLVRAAVPQCRAKTVRGGHAGPFGDGGARTRVRGAGEQGQRLTHRVERCGPFAAEPVIPGHRVRVQDTQPLLARADSISGLGVGVSVGRCRAPRAGCLEQISLIHESRIAGRRPAGSCQLISGAFLVLQFPKCPLAADSLRGVPLRLAAGLARGCGGDQRRELRHALG